jgi:hypothetical protein
MPMVVQPLRKLPTLAMLFFCMNCSVANSWQNLFGQINQKIRPLAKKFGP